MSPLKVYVLAILLCASQVHPLLDERDEIGTCRYDQTSVAVLSCTQPDKIWRPPSATCCKALLYAVDDLPVSADSGACCLCRYMRAKHALPELVTSYIMCKGKGSNAATEWTSFPRTSCSIDCGHRNRSSTVTVSKDIDPPHAQGAADSSVYTILWMVACVAICVTTLIYLWRWVKRTADAPQTSGRGSSPRIDSSWISSSGRRAPGHLKERRSSSSRSSPNS